MKAKSVKRFNSADLQVKEAKIISPNTLAKMIRKGNDPVLITGGKLLEDEILTDLAAEIAERGEMEVIATGGSSKPLIDRYARLKNIENGKAKGKYKTIIKVTTLHHFTQKVLDGLYDRKLLMFLGFEPYLLSRVLSSINQFSKTITVSIDLTYQPHAKFSFPNCENYNLLETLISFL